jgi:hypothetical protein
MSIFGEPGLINELVAIPERQLCFAFAQERKDRFIRVSGHQEQAGGEDEAGSQDLAGKPDICQVP